MIQPDNDEGPRTGRVRGDTSISAIQKRAALASRGAEQIPVAIIQPGHAASKRLAIGGNPTGSRVAISHAWEQSDKKRRPQNGRRSIGRSVVGVAQNLEQEPDALLGLVESGSALDEG